MIESLDHNLLAFLIPIAFGIDMLLTYNYMQTYRRGFPEDKEWVKHELNPIARWAWRRYGLERGSLIALLIACPIAIWFTVFSYYSTLFLGILIGTYIIVFRMHIYAKKHLVQGIARHRREEEMKKAKDRNTTTHTNIK